MIYFARMLDKIRKFASGTLREDFHENLGISLDGICCQYLRVEYNDLKAQVLSGLNDEEVYQWCMDNGRSLNDVDKRIWNSFASKLGWNDTTTPSLIERKKSSGLADRDEIQTMLEYFEYDEGRKS